MLDINMIREDPSVLKSDLKKRKDTEKLKWVDDLLVKEEEYRKLLHANQKLRTSRNELTKEIRELKKAGKDVKSVLAEVKEVPEKIKKNDLKLEKLKSVIDEYMYRLPNITHSSVPYGKDETENVEVRKRGKIPKFNFSLKSHVEIAEKLGGADFDRSAKLAGSGFYILKGGLARLNQALIRYATDFMISKGFEYVEPPLMMRKEPYQGVTDLADFENVMYKIEDDDLYLIATSEHPMAAMYMNEVIDKDDLPLNYVGYSMCFRREVGSRGLDTKGLFRTHQFNKVEQFVFCDPADSWKMHEELLKNSEELFGSLGLPYRVVNICTGDLGIVAAKKYDIEVWMPRQNAYKEVCSCSNCTDYQARRLGIKFGREGSPDNKYLHTLNNTAIATGRALVAILENFQNADGSVNVPKVLWPYMGGTKKLE